LQKSHTKETNILQKRPIIATCSCVHLMREGGSRSRAHTHAVHKHTNKHIHTHVCTHAHSFSHTQSGNQETRDLSHTCARTHTHAVHKHTQKYTHAFSLSHTLEGFLNRLTCTRVLAVHTLIRTYIHTHSLSLSRTHSLSHKVAIKRLDWEDS